jgi:uncharacterized membrane protein
MKKNLLTWIVVFVALLPAVYLLLIWPSLPQTVPVHFGADMKPDRLGHKGELWLTTGMLAVVSVFVYFLLTNLHRFDPKRKDATQSATFQKLAAGITVFIAALNFLILSSAKGGTTIQGFLFPLLGLMFAFMGNYMNHIRPNYFAGFRLPWTLSNDENWRRTHQLGGKLWFAGGLLIAVVCLFLKPPASFIFFIGVMVMMVLIPVVYSYRLFKKGF